MMLNANLFVGMSYIPCGAVSAVRECFYLSNLFCNLSKQTDENILWFHMGRSPFYFADFLLSFGS